MSPNINAIPFARPFLRSAELRAVRRVLKSGWLSTGKEALAFEKEFREALEDKDENLVCLSVNSATAGLHLALEALGIKPGDLVALPTLTFTASAQIIRYLGADPLFIDSEPKSGNIDPKALALACQKAQGAGKKVKAIIPVHLAGYPCDMKTIRAIASEYKAAIVEDAAHCFPSSGALDEKIGCGGDIGVFSFYATKPMTTGEGGMVVTRCPKLAARMRLMRLHGIDRNVWERYGGKAKLRSWEYDIKAPGFKYNLSDLAASLGRVQLRRSQKLFSLRQNLAQRYQKFLRNLNGLELPEMVEGHAWHLFIIHLKTPAQRDRLAEALLKAQIGSSVHFIPLHRMSYWKEQYPLFPKDFPVAERLSLRRISLPLWPGLTQIQQNRIIRVIRHFFLGESHYG